MTRKLTTLFAASAILAGLGTTTAALAEGTANPSQPPQHSTGMMGEHRTTMGQMDPDHMKQMTRMADNCNRMMESMNNMPMQPGGEQNHHDQN